MRTMLAAQGITYVHVLQPNRYFTSRPFTPEEAAVALNADSPFKSGVEQGYPALLKEAAAQGLERGRGFSTARTSLMPSLRRFTSITAVTTVVSATSDWPTSSLARSWP